MHNPFESFESTRHPRGRNLGVDLLHSELCKHDSFDSGVVEPRWGRERREGQGKKMERTVSRWWSMCLHVPVPTFVETRLCNRLLSLPSLYTRLSRISRDTILLPRMKIRERVQGFFILRIIKEFYFQN